MFLKWIIVIQHVKVSAENFMKPKKEKGWPSY